MFALELLSFKDRLQWNVESRSTVHRGWVRRQKQRVTADKWTNRKERGYKRWMSARMLNTTGGSLAEE